MATPEELEVVNQAIDVANTEVAKEAGEDPEAV